MPRIHEEKRSKTHDMAAADAAEKRSRKGLDGLPYDAQRDILRPSQPPPVMCKGRGTSTDSGAAVRKAAQEGVTEGGGRLPHLEPIQKAFGAHDVSDVRAHVGGAASDASTKIGAAAYAVGNDVAFSSEPDLFTAAHEATHVIQQRGGVCLSQGVGQAGDRYEHHADTVANHVVQGKSVEGLLDAHTASKDATGSVQMLEDDLPVLTDAQVGKALSYNQTRALGADIWAQVAEVIGAGSEVLDGALVLALAAWQASKGLEADGMVGNFTFQWLSQQPGGKGLETLVTSNATVYLGINPTSRGVESRHLGRNAGRGNVTAIKGSEQQDTASVDGARVDLNTEEGLNAFIGSLEGITDARAVAIMEFMKEGRGKALDELAMFVRVLNEAEMGKRLIKRAVLSGHSGGWSIVGEADNATSISFTHMQSLGTIFPMALGQVEDLMISGCNTGQKSKLDKYTQIFPNLKSIWAYVGYSPSAATGSIGHIVQWERSSRGAMDPEKMHQGRQRIAAGTGKRDQNVAVWTRDEGGDETYATASEEANRDYATMRQLVDNNIEHYYRAFNDGIIDRTVLSTLYTQMQNLLGSHSHRMTEEERVSYDLMIKRTLYLRYWDNVTKCFMEMYGEAIRSGYEGTSVAMPRYSGVGRDGALKQIADYPGGSGDEALKLLQDYLRDLNPDLIPDSWF